MVLQGGLARSLLPVGFKSFAASVAAAAAAASAAGAAAAAGGGGCKAGEASSSGSSSVHPAAAAAAGAAAGSPDQCGPQPNTQLGVSGSTSSAPQQQQQQQQPQQQQRQQHTPCTAPLLLGATASAAWAPSVGVSGVPGPLTATWKAVGAVLAPLLHPSSAAVELAVSLLLWGPRGSGRRTAARAAAAALGCNVIELSCHDLKVGAAHVFEHPDLCAGRRWRASKVPAHHSQMQALCWSSILVSLPHSYCIRILSKHLALAAAHPPAQRRALHPFANVTHPLNPLAVTHAGLN